MISDVTYQVGLDLTWKQDRFRSGTLARFRCAAPGAGTVLDLTAQQLERLELNGRPQALEILAGGHIRLADPRRDNEVLVLAECSYAGAGAGLRRFRDPVDGHLYCFTRAGEGTGHRIHACFDDPDLEATLQLGVLVPAGWVVISNSQVAHRPPPAGAGWWVFAPTPPLPARSAVMAAGPYTSVTLRHRSIDLSVHCRQSQAPRLEAAEILRITAEGLEFFERIFDAPYPFGQGYDQVLVPDLEPGGTGGPGCAILPETLILPAGSGAAGATGARRVTRAEAILGRMASMWSGSDPPVAAVRDLLGRHALASATLHEFLSGLCEISRQDLR